MSKAWSHLPNAHHIDWVLKSVSENPELWSAAWNADWNADWYAAMDAAMSATWSAARDAAWSAARDADWYATRAADWNAAWGAARGAAWGVMSALVFYDDCDQFLNMPYEKLRVCAVLGEDPRSILLRPLIYVKEKLNEQSMVALA